MEFITQIRKLSLWIFIIPFVAINLCLFISVNYQIFENTFLVVDQIGRSNPTFPYIDGGVSISRTARTYPTYLIFKPSMIFGSILLILYWIKTNNLIIVSKTKKKIIFSNFWNTFRICLIIHSIFLVLNLIMICINFLEVGFISFIIFDCSTITTCY